MHAQRGLPTRSSAPFQIHLIASGSTDEAAYNEDPRRRIHLNQKLGLGLLYPIRRFSRSAMPTVLATIATGREMALIQQIPGRLT